MPTIDKQKSSNVKKQRLGRGLGSLLSTGADEFENAEPKKVAARPHENKPATQVASQKTSPVMEKAPQTKEIDPSQRVWSLAIDKVFPNKTQPRKDFHKEPLQELADSIKEQGLLQPITVRKKDGKYEIIAGERRWRASQLAGLHEVPAIVKDVDDRKSMELALIENLQRENLNPVEEALGYQLLMDDYDLSQQEVAKKVGKNRTTVTNSLRILTLPKEIRGWIREGKMMVGHAKVLLSLEDPVDQVKLAQKTMGKKLSVRALEKEIRKLGKSKSSSINAIGVSERLAEGLATDLQKVLGTKVNIQYKSGKGKIEISFYSDDELSQFCERIKETWHLKK
ncbi:MAG: ParB/RepB/Spo0J family partition protein [Bdellovibrionales bacterium]|nr:ParB/RepB/Spo0J family partition protein [Bdellovibrionales bacterium]